jgi:hypothetical protein
VTADPIIPIESRRLLAAIYPTRAERVVESLSDVCYRLAEVDEDDPPDTRYGLFGWAGDRFMELFFASTARRAAYGRHLTGRDIVQRRDRHRCSCGHDRRSHRHHGDDIGQRCCGRCDCPKFIRRRWWSR